MSHDNNPYRPPEADLGVESIDGNGGDFSVTGIKKLPAGRGWEWIKEGFEMFKANPGVWVLLAIVYLIIVIVLSFIPLLGSLALNVINPVFIAGIMLACVAIYNRENFSVGHLFKGFQIPQTGRLCLLGLLLLVIIFGIMMVVGIIAAVVLGASGGFEMMLANGGPGIGMILMFLVVMLVMLPITMMMYFAPPLVALSDVSITESLSLSFRGCLKNMLPFLVFGLIAILLSIIAIIPFGLGLLVLMPVMFAALFCAYKDIYTSA